MAELTRSISSDVSFTETDQLVTSLQACDEAAFQQIFHLYRDLIYNLVSHVLADKSESMDVTQEVFLTLFRKIDTFRGECNLKTWIYRIAVNQAASRNRWWKRRFWSRTVSLDLGNRAWKAPAADLLCHGASPARECFSAELEEALRGALRGLPFEQKVAVMLRDVEGLTYEEITEVTGARIGTVKSRIARGREKLRAVLEKYRGGETL
jgi:RNA polymerase sigma-70 factor (ECF subfamily)